MNFILGASLLPLPKPGSQYSEKTHVTIDVYSILRQNASKPCQLHEETKLMPA